MKNKKIASAVMAAVMCASLFGCAAKEDTASEKTAESESAVSSESAESVEAEPTPEPVVAPVFTKIDTPEPNNCGINGYEEDSYYQLSLERLDSTELTPCMDDNGQQKVCYTGNKIYTRPPHVGEGDYDIRCIVSGAEVLDLSDDKDELYCMDPDNVYDYNPYRIVRTEETCEKVYFYFSDDELESAKDNLLTGKSILNGDFMNDENNCIVLNGLYVQNTHFERRDDGKIYVSLADLAGAYDHRTTLDGATHCLIVPQDYGKVQHFPTVNTPEDTFENLNIGGSVNTDKGTFTYSSLGMANGWEDEFPLSDDDDKYTMSTEEISRILGWDFYLSDDGKILKVITDDLDEAKPENMIVHKMPM